MARAASIGNTVHKRQLFHWIGSHLERDKSLTSRQRNEKYLQCLKDSLDHGLWLTRSLQELEADHGGETPRDVKPMVCFTDNRLSECAYHAQNYGKLGLGFPKRFVINQFGGPVNYVSHKQRRNLYFKYIYDVHRHLEASNHDGDHDEVIDKLGYVMSFLKPIAKRAKSRRPSTPKPPTLPKATPKPPPTEKARSYGPPLNYLVENEWRIVADATVIRRLNLELHPEYGARGTYLLRYKAKKDLFSIVLPNRPTLQMALSDDAFRDRLQRLPQTNLYVLDEVAEL